MEEILNKIKGKNLKVVWKDLNEEGNNKACYGELTDVSDKFICIIQNGKPVIIGLDFIVTIKEIEKCNTK